MDIWAYKCPFDKKLSKMSTSEKLHEVISSSESMLNTSTFGNLGSPDESRLNVNLAPFLNTGKIEQAQFITSAARFFSHFNLLSVCFCFLGFHVFQVTFP
jgi:hypothetical protein